MQAYWDTSAILALIFEEPNSLDAQVASKQAGNIYMWEWAQVEAESALLRRGAEKQDWDYLNEIFSVVNWVSSDKRLIESVKVANKKWKLRTMDAAHLYIASQLDRVLDNFALVSFDKEMRAAARSDGLKVCIARNI